MTETNVLLGSLEQSMGLPNQIKLKFKHESNDLALSDAHSIQSLNTRLYFISSD